MALKLNWTRDPNVSYPNTWQSFKAKGPNTDELREYVIKDVTEDHFDEIFDLFVKSYAVAEPIAVVTSNTLERFIIENVKKRRELLHIFFRHGNKRGFMRMV